MTNCLLRRGVPFSLVLTCWVGSAAAQTSSRENVAPAHYPIKVEAAPRPTIHAARATTPMTIDGALDEQAWESAESVDNFIQAVPHTGYPASERTVVRVLYDLERLYIGAICYDSEPSKIVITGIEQDFDSINSDTFGFSLDPFHDRRNGYWFMINAAGALKDTQAFDDSRNQNNAWEGVTYQKTRVNAEGWTVEMAIPFTTLRFDPERADQDWGINFVRRVRRKNEDAFWAPLDRRDKVHRMSRAGTLTGLQGLRAGRNLQVKPFVVGANTTGSLRPADVKPSKFDGGLDVKYGVTPSLSLDATYRTDFSQIEVDQEQVNLTRFSLFFPEKRDFFMENEGIFQFGDLAEQNSRNGGSLRDFTLFHSRRIGLTSSGKPIPIVGGGRLTGKVAGVQVGLMNMQTDNATGAAAENFSVLRVRRNVFGTSDVGVIYTDSQKTGTGPAAAYGRSYGVDVNLRPRRNLVVQSYLAATTDPATRGNNVASRFLVGWRDPLWDTSVFVKQVGDAFNPRMGFIRRRNMRHTYATFGAHPRPKLPSIQELNPYVELDYITDIHSVLDTRTATFGLDADFLDGGRFSLQYRDNFERIVEPFKISSGAVVSPGSYAFRETLVGYHSNGGRKLSGSLTMAGGGYYGGTKTTLGVGALWRPSYHVAMEMTLNHNGITLHDKSYSADVFGANVKVGLSTILFANGFFQYNAADNQTVVNLRADYLHSPLSDLFVAYTERRDTRAGGGALERVFSIKLTKMLAF